LLNLILVLKRWLQPLLLTLFNSDTLKILQKFIQNYYHSPSRGGETLIEVIIAVFVVALGSAIATSLIVSALQSNSLSRDNLIGMNLAEEGIEAVRSIRDTNWLKYGFDKENCWNILPSAPTCDTAQAITAGYYAVEMDENFVWQMTKISSQEALDLTTNSPTNDPYRLEIVTRNTNNISFYSHNKLSHPAGVNYQEQNSDPEDGRFYRMIEILNVAPDSMEVRSTVQWISQGHVNTAPLSAILTNYQKVKK